MRLPVINPMEGALAQPSDDDGRERSGKARRRVHESSLYNQADHQADHQADRAHRLGQAGARGRPVPSRD